MSFFMTVNPYYSPGMGLSKLAGSIVKDVRTEIIEIMRNTGVWVPELAMRAKF